MTRTAHADRTLRFITLSLARWTCPNDQMCIRDRDRPADTRAGCKHRCTDATMEYFKAEVMELCHRENLYQIDLLHGSKNRITEREYWAQRKGQAKLDKEAAALPAEEQPAKPTKFETDKMRTEEQMLQNQPQTRHKKEDISL